MHVILWLESGSVLFIFILDYFLVRRLHQSYVRLSVPLSRLTGHSESCIWNLPFPAPFYIVKRYSNVEYSMYPYDILSLSLSVLNATYTFA